MQLRRGQSRHAQNPLDHQTITGAAVIENVHQRHARRFRGLAVIHHHLNAKGPQGHRGGHGHQGGGPIRSPDRHGRQLQAVQGEAETGPGQTGHQPPQQQNRIAQPA